MFVETIPYILRGHISTLVGNNIIVICENSRIHAGAEDFKSHLRSNNGMVPVLSSY